MLILTPRLTRPSCRCTSLPLALLVVTACWLPAPAVAQLPTIEVTSLTQSAAQLGSKIDLGLRGSRLDELQSLTFSTTDVVATAQSTPPRVLSDEPTLSGRFDVSIATRAAGGSRTWPFWTLQPAATSADNQSHPAGHQRS